MALVFIYQSGHVVLVVHVLPRLVQRKLLEVLVLGRSELDTLGSQQLMHHVFLDVALPFGVEDPERG